MTTARAPLKDIAAVFVHSRLAVFWVVWLAVSIRGVVVLLKGADLTNALLPVVTISLLIWLLARVLHLPALPWLGLGSSAAKPK